MVSEHQKGLKQNSRPGYACKAELLATLCLQSSDLVKVLNEKTVILGQLWL